MKLDDQLRLQDHLVLLTAVMFLIVIVFGPRGLDIFKDEETLMADEQPVNESDEGDVQVGQPGAGEFRDIELLRQRL